ncbi:hypothetical protein [Parapedobacter lycopersici]|uniref:hypothetical protein n=1 Tax=Parapedobacter lycopersici TaxID=1864939 RepID=UPI0033421BD5
MIKYVLLLAVLLGCARATWAQQRPTYTLLEAGGILGLRHSGGLDAMNGYQFHFAFGRNFYDKAYLGLGIGNDVYRGRSTTIEGTRTTSRVNTLPIFADFRVPLAAVSMLGRLSAMANVGYAPGIGGDYFKGFVAKGGLTYSHLLGEGSDLLFSFGYGFQQFDSRFPGYPTFHQHNLFLTIGLFVH